MVASRRLRVCGEERTYNRRHEREFHTAPNHVAATVELRRAGIRFQWGFFGFHSTVRHSSRPLAQEDGRTACDTADISGSIGRLRALM